MIAPQRRPDGSLLVPSPAYGPDGLVGDGWRIALPGTPLFELWEPFA